MQKGDNEGVMFCVGGDDKKTGKTRRADIFAPLHSWTRIADMLEVRLRPAAACLRNKLYVSGGTGEKDEPLKSVEIFDTDTGKWSPGVAMATPRYGHALVCLNEALYALGGHDGQSALRTADKFTLDTNSWKPISPMLECRFA